MIFAMALFLVLHMQSQCSFIHSILCQTYVVTFSELQMFETKIESFYEVIHLVVILFATKFIVSVVVLAAFFLCSCIKAPLCATFNMIVEHEFKRNFTFLSQSV